jgi:hypothetical protein
VYLRLSFTGQDTTETSLKNSPRKGVQLQCETLSEKLKSFQIKLHQVTSTVMGARLTTPVKMTFLIWGTFDITGQMTIIGGIVTFIIVSLSD